MPSIKAALSLAALAGSALAQLRLTSINLPAAGTTVTAGTDITVEIGFQTYIDSIDNIALAIGLQSCAVGACLPASEMLGTILYKGPFAPTAYTSKYHNNYQDITVTIPASFSAGAASLTVTNFYAVGESNVPTAEYLNQTLIIA